jgi:hypothetical protein
LAAGQTISGLCQPPDLFATALDLAGIPPVPWVQGKSLASRLNAKGKSQAFAVGGCHPHKGKASCLTVLTDEWCLIYSPLHGLEGSELYHRPTGAQTKNVIAENRAMAQQLFGMLGSWLEELNVPPARRSQLLHGSRFNWFQRAKHRLWMLKNRGIYEWRYRNYTRGSAPVHPALETQTGVKRPA